MKIIDSKIIAVGFLALSALLPGCVDTHHGTSVSAGVTYNPGYEVRALPSGYRTEVVGGTSYYISNGVYYRPRSGRYVVVEAPRSGHYMKGRNNTMITRLPSGYRVVNIRGKRYYQHGGVYYQQGSGGYVVVRP